MTSRRCGMSRDFCGTAPADLLPVFGYPVWYVEDAAPNDGERPRA
jgi:hypothetical protein